MFRLDEALKVYLHREPIDFRLNINGLALMVEKALGLLRFSTRHSSRDLEKLLMSAIANWEAKNEGRKADEAALKVTSVQVNEARGLKRMLPAPQGRAYRMKKRSNHVSLIVDSTTAQA